MGAIFRRGKASQALAGLLRGLSLLLCSAGVLAVSSLSVSAAELIVFEQKGCPFCEKFDAEIAAGYAESALGHFAPLRRANIHDDRRAGIAGLSPAVFTPTFVLVDDEGREVGRLEGYPGERWFYPEMEEIASRLPGFALDRAEASRPEGQPRPQSQPQATPVPTRQNVLRPIGRTKDAPTN